MEQNIRVGFIGLGLMGIPMAKNILKHGFALGVYNRTQEKTKILVEKGATTYTSPKELAENVDVVISMVTGPTDVEEIYLGKNGIAQSHNTNIIAIDMSTIGPKTAKNIAKRLKEKQMAFLDAPVTGSTYKAETGELTIFIGGDETIYEKAKPVLRAMGNDLQYMGASGSGQAIKLVNNFLVAATITALGEAMLLSDALQLPRKKAAKALENVAGISPYMKLKLPNVVKRTYPLAFSLTNMRKDLNLAVNESGMKTENHMFLLPIINDLFNQGMEMDLGNEDLSAILEVLTKNAQKKS